MKKILLLAILLIGILGCGQNPSVVDFPLDDVFDGGDELDPDPCDNGGCDDPDDDPIPPGPMYDVVKAIQFDSIDREEAILPYNDKLFKKSEFHKPRKSLVCKTIYKKNKDKCVHDRQVLMAFDVTDVRDKMYNGAKVKDIYLVGSFYSVGLNFKTELLCMLDIKRCSGKGILLFGGTKLPYLVKMPHWDKSYWSVGYNKVVTTTYFQDLLITGKIKKNKLYKKEGIRLSLKKMYNLTQRELESLVFKKGRMRFALTDDTYVENPKLLIRYSEL